MNHDMRKVALFINLKEIPESVAQLFPNSLDPNNSSFNPAERMDPKKITILDQMSITLPKIHEDPVAHATCSHETIVKRQIDDRLYYGHKHLHWGIMIVNVDVSRPWHINVDTEYDEILDDYIETREYIEYLDYEIIDPNINYCLKIKKS